MPIQLRRVLFVFLALTFLFLIVRKLLIPESFGEIGHYRAKSVIENQQMEPKYTGNEFCVDCHEAEAELISNGTHSQLTCETCHGPGNVHIESNEKTDILRPSGRDFCALCHHINAARSESMIRQVNVNEHNPEEETCTNCHNPHQPWN